VEIPENNGKIMIHAWLQFKFTEICRNCQLLLDLSMLGDDWMPIDDKLLSNLAAAVNERNFLGDPEEHAAVTQQRRASHEDQMPVHEARDLVALQHMHIK
jgi:hypothetical protein